MRRPFLLPQSQETPLLELALDLFFMGLMAPTCLVIWLVGKIGAALADA